MYYIIYKITNIINNNIYIGSHKTLDINDNYMGSGKYLKYAINKYGLDNFKKEILFLFDNPADMYKKEAELVNIDFISEEYTYNLKCGGFGGFDFINNQKINNKANQCAKGGKTASLKGGGFKGKKHSAETKENLSKKLIGRSPTFLGKNHSTETKMKMSESHLGLGRGEKNSQFGSMWIHCPNLKQNKKMLKTDSIPEGWIKGRKIKF